MNYLVTDRSSNTKVGPVLVTTSPKSTCPASCPLLGACYADNGPLGGLWRNLSKAPTRARTMPNGRGKVRLHSWRSLLDKVAALPRDAVWRHNQAGDLAADPDGNVDRRQAAELTAANDGRRGIVYTHHQPTPHNADVYRAMDRRGLHVNFSADNLTHADRVRADNPELNLVAIGPADLQEKSGRTADGHPWVRCPQTYTPNLTCAQCALCARRRKAIVVFPAHGARKNDTMRRVGVDPVDANAF